VRINSPGRLATMLAVAALAAGTLLAVGSAHADPGPEAQGVQIDAGGAGGGGFAADSYFTGGAAASNPGLSGNPNWPGGVTHPIPSSVWDNYRFLESTYTVPGLVPGLNYQVRLYFLDWYWTRVGNRVFDVKINGATVLSNFDIIKAAVDLGGDGSRLGIERTFTVTANTAGTITIEFIRGTADQPLINAIVLVPATA
jgi:Malectin domain